MERVGIYAKYCTNCSSIEDNKVEKEDPGLRRLFGTWMLSSVSLAQVWGGWTPVHHPIWAGRTQHSGAILAARCHHTLELVDH